MLVVTNMTGQVSSMSVIRGTNDLCANLVPTMFVITGVKNIHVLL